ncbi:MAG: hypothetical protein MH472_14620 [Bacteroidia bacterium]|nr:hypothetical protein [Bacteroidia bacterium]
MKFKTIVVILISIFCCNQEKIVKSKKENINKNLLKVYIPKTIFNSFDLDQVESDVMYDTIIKYSYFNKTNPELKLEIIEKENFKDESVEKIFNKEFELLKLDFSRNLKINYKYHINFSGRDIFLLDYKILHDSNSIKNMKILCNSANRNKQLTINISYSSKNNELNKLLRDSIPFIISSMEIK